MAQRAKADVGVEEKKSAASSDLNLRIMSALVLAPIVLVSVWLGGLVFQFLLAVAVILMAYEWARLTCGPNWRIDAIIMAATALAAILAASMGNYAEIGWIIVGGTLVAGGRSHEFRWSFLGVPYISLAPVALVWLRGLHPDGLALILWLLLVIWAMDIGAYFAGRAIGGPKLAPRASPNKTWAGLIGGMLGAAIMGVLVGGVVTGAKNYADAQILALPAALLGAWSQAGDIAESLVKRHFGVKDMSQLIPGHGGILDRVDGLLFAAPALALVQLLVMGMP